MRAYLYSPKTTTNNFNDEFKTPTYAVKPILKYLKPNSKIWCPFDTIESNFVSELIKAGHEVIFTHTDSNTDFFSPEYDEVFASQFNYIISNPPYSCKDKILTKLYKLGIPFMLLLPVVSLTGMMRCKLFSEYGLELLILDKRTNFNDLKAITFNTSYFCWKTLPQPLIFENLQKD